MKYWFRRKRYGYGWTPATWEGWLVTLGFVVLLLLAYPVMELFISVEDQPLIFVLTIVTLALILIKICYTKGESPKWQWG